jgi:hypothetical protein
MDGLYNTSIFCLERDTMPSNQDQRILKRRHLIYYLSVFNRVNNELLGHLVDITPDGLMIIGEKMQPVDMDFQLHMTLPQEIMGKDQLDFDAHSVWCRKDADPSFYGTGFELTNITPEDMRLIGKLIQNFSFHD